MASTGLASATGGGCLNSAHRRYLALLALEETRAEWNVSVHSINLSNRISPPSVPSRPDSEPDVTLVGNSAHLRVFVAD